MEEVAVAFGKWDCYWSGLHAFSCLVSCSPEHRLFSWLLANSLIFKPFNHHHVSLMDLQALSQIERVVILAPPIASRASE